MIITISWKIEAIVYIAFLEVFGFFLLVGTIVYKEMGEYGRCMAGQTTFGCSPTYVADSIVIWVLLPLLIALGTIASKCAYERIAKILKVKAWAI